MLPSDVIAYGAALFKLDVADLLRDCRLRPVCRARYALYLGLYLRAELRGTQPVYARIGRWLQRDHSTVIHGIRRAQQMMETDADFVEAVYSIATASFEDVQKACKPSLPVLQEAPQQPERPTMDNPEYTEARINEALAAHRPARRARLEVYWDGDIVTRDEPARFRVYIADEETDYCVADSGHAFAIEQWPEASRLVEIGRARTYSGLAERLAAIFVTEEA